MVLREQRLREYVAKADAETASKSEANMNCESELAEALHTLELEKRQLEEPRADKDVAQRARKLLRSPSSSRPQIGSRVKSLFPPYIENDALFSLETDYDENIYTTAINKNHPQYMERYAAAKKKAREIEHSASVAAHVAEERAMDLVGGSGSGGAAEMLGDSLEVIQ